jgi:hypothetical protein
MSSINIGGIEIDPTWASVIAAGFSAFAALTMVRIQRQNLIESCRPLLLPKDWERKLVKYQLHDGTNSHEKDELEFKQLANVGKGPALNIFMNVTSKKEEDKPIPSALFSTQVIPIIASGDAHSITDRITLDWRFSSYDEIRLLMEISYSSLQNVRYEQTYALTVRNLNANGVFMSSGKIAEGVFLHHRGTETAHTESFIEYLFSILAWPFKVIEKIFL